MRLPCRLSSLPLLVVLLSWLGTAPTSLAFPASIDSDIYASIVSPTSYSDFIFAGRLQLALKQHSTVLYQGSFYDYETQKAYPATVDATDPNAAKLSIASSNGSFIFAMDTSFGSTYYSGNSTRVPTILKNAGGLYLSASPHSSTTDTYNVVMTQRIGLFTPLYYISGQLAITHDANNRVSGGTTYFMDSKGHAYHGLVRGSGYYYASYLYLHASFGPKTFGIYGTFSTSTSWNGAAFTGSGASAAEWVISGTQ